MSGGAAKKDAAKTQDGADADAASAPGAKKRGKLLKLLMIIVPIVGLAGGGGYWYLNQNKSRHAAEAKPQPAKPPVFVPLEAFTVNLQLEENSQFLQTVLTLKVSDNAVVDTLKLYMPEVRDRILLLLSARKASELLTVDGKRKLSIDIVQTVNHILAPPPKAARAAKKKPARKPKPVAEDEAEGAAEGEEKAAEIAAEETAEAAEEAPPSAHAAAPAPPPVLSVLFTSFIIQ